MRPSRTTLFGAACTAAALALQAMPTQRGQAQTRPSPLPASKQQESPVRLPQNPAAQDMSPALRLASANNRFGLRLFASLQKDHEAANLCISPTSIAQALQMIANGASGSTHTGMVQALTLEDMTPEAVNQGNNTLLDSLTGGSAAAPRATLPSPSSAVRPQLDIVNSLWIASPADLRPEFVKQTRTYYHAEVGSLQGAPQNINTWVDRHTHGKITKIVSADDVKHAVAVLVNAVYFKGLWSTPFPAEQTVDKPFHMTLRDQTTCKMMTQSGHFDYMQNHLFQMVRLPYQGNRLEMRIVLPKVGTTLETLVPQCTAESWQQWTRKLIAIPGEVELPRFRAEFGVTLNQSLASLGMGIAFGKRADFSAMSSKPLYLSKVLHKTFVEVDEKGTEAAAATAGVMRMKSARPVASPFRMVMDRPFLYAICDRQTGAMLFLGTLNRPTAGS